MLPFTEDDAVSLVRLKVCEPDHLVACIKELRRSFFITGGNPLCVEEVAISVVRDCLRDVEDEEVSSSSTLQTRKTRSLQIAIDGFVSRSRSHSKTSGSIPIDREPVLPTQSTLGPPVTVHSDSQPAFLEMQDGFGGGDREEIRNFVLHRFLTRSSADQQEQDACSLPPGGRHLRLTQVSGSTSSPGFRAELEFSAANSQTPFAYSTCGMQSQDQSAERSGSEVLSTHDHSQQSDEEVEAGVLSALPPAGQRGSRVLSVKLPKQLGSAGISNSSTAELRRKLPALPSCFASSARATTSGASSPRAQGGSNVTSPKSPASTRSRLSEIAWSAVVLGQFDDLQVEERRVLTIVSVFGEDGASAEMVCILLLFQTAT